METCRAGTRRRGGRGGARRLRGQEHVRGAAAAEGGRRGARAAHGDALCRGHRQHRADQERRSRRARAGLPAIDRLSGRPFVKQGTQLFTIEPETYKLKLEQAQAAEAGAQASLKQAEADFKRQVDLVQRQAVSQATLDTSTSTRDNAQASLQQAQANTRLAEVNYGYTKVSAPFDGIVSAHLVSIGELVGVSSPTQLATIVALDPIWVNFTVNEQDVLRIRAEAVRRGLTVADLRQLPIQVGLQTETGYPHEGHLDYVSPTLNSSTGTLAVRGLLPNDKRVLLPGYFVRVRVPFDQDKNALLVPDTALGSDQGGRYLLVVNKRQYGRAAQGADRSCRQRPARDRKRPEAGRPRGHRRAAARDPGPEDRPASDEDRAAAGVCQVRGRQP